MPAAIVYARRLCDTVYNYALKNNDKFGVDIKTQVTVDYGTKENFENGLPQKIHTIVVSAPCVEGMKIEEVRANIFKNASKIVFSLLNPMFLIITKLCF